MVTAVMVLLCPVCFFFFLFFNQHASLAMREGAVAYTQGGNAFPAIGALVVPDPVVFLHEVT